MSKPLATAFARVQITVEIEASSWGVECTVAQIVKQARESAQNALMRGLVIDGLKTGHDSKVPARIVGEPKVTVVTVDVEGGQ